MTEQVQIQYNDLQRVMASMETAVIPPGMEYGHLVQSSHGIVGFVLDDKDTVTITAGGFNGCPL